MRAAATAGKPKHSALSMDIDLTTSEVTSNAPLPWSGFVLLVVSMCSFGMLFLLYSIHTSLMYCHALSYVNPDRSAACHHAVKMHFSRAPIVGPRVIVSLTTTYDRLKLIKCTLRSLLTQDTQPDELVIAVPWKSRRFKVPYPEPSLDDLVGNFTNYTCKITILRCKDYGPGTKFVPTLLREQKAGRNDSLVVIVDDDVIYPRDHLRSMLEGAKLTNYKQAVGLRGWCVHSSNAWSWHIMANRYIHGSSLVGNQTMLVDIITGNNGLLVLPSFFHTFSIEITEESPPSAFYMDDIWINGILAKNAIDRVVVRTTVDPQHRGWVEKRSHTLESVPAGRAYHNTQLLQYFGKDWHHCNNKLRRAANSSVDRRKLLTLCERWGT